MAEKTCFQCSSVMEKALRCSRCKAALYCNGTCQKQHWPTHSKVCKRIEPQKVSPVPPPRKLPQCDKSIFMCFPIFGKPNQLLVYCTPGQLEPEEVWLGSSLALFDRITPKFQKYQLFLFFYLYLPKDPHSGEKAHYSYFSMVTGKDGAIFLQDHQKYLDDETYTVTVLKSSTIGKPLSYIVFTHKTNEMELSEDPPSGSKHQVYGTNEQIS